MRKNRFLKKSVYILTEGHTEEAYFSRLSEILGDEPDWQYAVSVEVREIIDGSKTDPFHMVKEASHSIKDYDEVWIVFDKDRDRDDQNLKAIQYATKKKMRVAYSSISFEHWILLHFEKNHYAFNRSDCESRGNICECNGKVCISSYIRTKGYISKYKKGSPGLYDELKKLEDKAIINAAWLRKKGNSIEDIVSLNPYSDVDILLSKLLNSRLVQFEKFDENFIVPKMKVRFYNKIITTHFIQLSIALMNNDEVSFLMNNHQNNIYINNGDEKIKYNIDNPIIIQPGGSINTTIQFKINDLAGNEELYLSFVVDKIYMVEL